MPAEIIVTHLQSILAQENINYEIPALWQLARAADGSMRDALSLLDQAIAYGNNQVNETDIYAMLGTLPAQQILPLLNALVANNAQQLINIITELAAYGADFHQVLEELLSLLQQIAVAQYVPDAIDQNNNQHENILALAKQMAAEDVQLYYQIALIGRRDLPFAPSPKMGFEMILLRMLAFKPDNFNPQKSDLAKSTGNIGNISETKLQPVKNNAIQPSQTTGSQNNSSATNNNWASILSQLNLSGMTLALANNCSLEKIEDNAVNLLLDPKHAALHNPRNDELLSKALQQYFNKAMKLNIRISTQINATPAQQQHSTQLAIQAAAKSTIENDPGVQSLLKTFDAKIHPESITAVDKNL